MKALVTVILFCLLALVSAKAGYTDALVEEAVEQCAVQSAGVVIPLESCENAFISGDADTLPLHMLRGDSRRLAHRVGLSIGRMHRFTTTETLLFIKALLRKMAIHMDSLVECRARVYDVAYSVASDNVCEYYIYAMRRILI